MQQSEKEQINQLKQFDADSSSYLKDMLFGDKLEKREKWHKLFEDPIFTSKFKFNNLAEERTLAFKRLQKVADAKLFSIFDFKNDPVNLYTAHEMLGTVDGSTATKFTVQNNLFGGTLMALATDKHLPFMKKVDSLKVMGCFCLTELGFGNNAPKMETTAVYDQASDSFTINCPTTASQKYWITNGACHANNAIVFAQTFVNGKKEGINSFIVPIREGNPVDNLDQMNECKGVTIEDMGIKIGLNGIDNGRLIFKNVKVPRSAMLDKMNQVNEKGEFISKTPKISQRFFKVADSLLSGRLCIAAMSMGSCKVGLISTVKYSQQRLAVGASGLSDTPIMSYQLNQNAIMPLIARTIVLNFGLNVGKNLYAANALTPTNETKTKIIKTCCVIKAMISWHSELTNRICRERCGGASYLSKNRISDMIWGSHSAMTAEGDNRVLMQKVVKDIFYHTQKGYHDAPKLSADRLKELKFSEYPSFENLRDMVLMRETFEIRKFGKLLRNKIFEEKKNFYNEWMFESNDDIQSLATAFGERFFIESAWKAYEECKHSGARNILRKIIHLHLVDLVNQNLAFYLTNDLMTTAFATKVQGAFAGAVRDLVPHINDCVEAFGLHKVEGIYPPMTRNWSAFNDQPDWDENKSPGPIFQMHKM